MTMARNIIFVTTCGVFFIGAVMLFRTHIMVRHLSTIDNVAHAAQSHELAASATGSLADTTTNKVKNSLRTFNISECLHNKTASCVRKRTGMNMDEFAFSIILKKYSDSILEHKKLQAIATDNYMPKWTKITSCISVGSNIMFANYTSFPPSQKIVSGMPFAGYNVNPFYNGYSNIPCFVIVMSDSYCLESCDNGRLGILMHTMVRCRISDGYMLSIDRRRNGDLDPTGVLNEDDVKNVYTSVGSVECARFHKIECHKMDMLNRFARCAQIMLGEIYPVGDYYRERHMSYEYEMLPEITLRRLSNRNSCTNKICKRQTDYKTCNSDHERLLIRANQRAELKDKYVIVTKTIIFVTLGIYAVTIVSFTISVRLRNLFATKACHNCRAFHKI